MPERVSIGRYLEVEEQELPTRGKARRVRYGVYDQYDDGFAWGYVLRVGRRVRWSYKSSGAGRLYEPAELQEIAAFLDKLNAERGRG